MADLTTQLQAAAGVGGGWDLSKATFNYGTGNYVNFFDSSGPFYISPDGLNVYYTTLTLTLYQLSLSTPFDLTTISLVRTRNISSFTNSAPFSFSPDGTRFITNRTDIRVLYAYQVTTPWDISTITGTGSSSIGHGLGGNVYTYMRADGLRLFALYASLDNIFTYALSSAFSLTGASTVSTFGIGGIDTLPQGLWFKDDGTRLYIVGDASNDITECALATAWNITTLSAVRTLSVATYSAQPIDVQLNPTGDKMFVSSSSSFNLNTYGVRGIYRYSLGTPWDISTAVIEVPPDNAFNVNAFEASPQGCAYNNDGTKFFIIGAIGDEINQFALSTPYNVSTASFTASFSVSGFDTAPLDLFFSPDGLNLYILGSTNDIVYQFSCGSPFNITTLGYAGKFKSLTSQTSFVVKFSFRPDGTYMYVADGSANDYLFEYVLGTPWDVSTASYTGVFVALSPIFSSSTIVGLAFSPDGTKAFMSQSSSGYVFQITMSTPWDITTLSVGAVTFTYVKPTYFSYLATGLTISSDGLHMAFAGGINARISYSIDL